VLSLQLIWNRVFSVFWREDGQKRRNPTQRVVGDLTNPRLRLPLASGGLLRQIALPEVPPYQLIKPRDCISPSTVASAGGDLIKPRDCISPSTIASTAESVISGLVIRERVNIWTDPHFGSESQVHPLHSPCNRPKGSKFHKSSKFHSD